MEIAEVGIISGLLAFQYGVMVTALDGGNAEQVAMVRRLLRFNGAAAQRLR